MRAILRCLRYPYTRLRGLADRYAVPARVRMAGVNLGQDCTFRGLPCIHMVAESSITLGSHVLINSAIDSNPIGLAHPTMLSTLERGSFIRIGDNTGISGASIVARCGITIGRRVLIGAGACIWDTDFHPLNPTQRRLHPTRDAATAPIVIDDEVFIGAEALILKGVTVGPGAVIAARAVVVKDVKAGEIVAGNPARVIGSVETR